MASLPSLLSASPRHSLSLLIFIIALVAFRTEILFTLLTSCLRTETVSFTTPYGR